MQEHTCNISRLHRLLLELIPGGATEYLPAAQAKRSSTGSDPTTHLDLPSRLSRAPTSPVDLGVSRATVTKVGVSMVLPESQGIDGAQ